MAGLPRTEFAQALKAITTERGLDPDVILETIRQAYVAAYKRDARESGIEVDELEYDAEIDKVTGEAKILAWDPEKPEEKRDVTPPGFGRIAAQTAKQVKRKRELLWMNLNRVSAILFQELFFVLTGQMCEWIWVVLRELCLPTSASPLSA